MFPVIIPKHWFRHHYVQLLWLLSLGLSLTACSTAHDVFVIDGNPVNASFTQQQVFTQDVEQHLWLQESYQAFKLLTGYKAFAVNIKDNEVIHVGVSHDKISSFLADAAALRQCYFNSAGAGRCVIVERHDQSGNHGLSAMQIDNAPLELTTYRSISRYQYYLKAKPPKAFALSSCSSQSFWSSNQNNLRHAKQKAMSACQSNHATQLPCCKIVATAE